MSALFNVAIYSYTTRLFKILLNWPYKNCEFYLAPFPVFKRSCFLSLFQQAFMYWYMNKARP
jgi:hypothetical protein